MGETPVNMFGGSPLNRLSWLRPSHAFLNALILSPTTRWVLFNAGQPLVAASPHTPAKRSLAYLTTNDVKAFLGQEPFFGQGKDGNELVSSSDQTTFLEAARHRGIPIVFLGLQEFCSTDNALSPTNIIDARTTVANLEGTPYFSMDVADSDLGEAQIEEVLKASEPSNAGNLLSWSDPRSIISSLDGLSAGVFAEARSMVDWNRRNKFCPACGSPTYSLWGGWKLLCGSLLPWADLTSRKPCPTANGLHNFTHPRTDPVVIMIAIDETGENILLGRNKKYPGNFYSALAGFVEPGESFEDAVKREMWEEAGIKVWDVRYHSGQPWPYPANLMVGFYARADASRPIRIDLDNELEDAQWYSRSLILSVLGMGASLPSHDHKKDQSIAKGAGVVAHSDPSVESKPRSADETEVAVNQPVTNDPPFRLPPVAAIAGLLIRDWADGKIGFGSTVLKKGNL